MTQVASHQQIVELEKKYLKVQPSSDVENAQSLVDWIAESQWMCMVESSSFNFPSFPEKNDVFQVYYCSIEDKKISNLFRTLIALGGTLHNRVEYQKEKDLFVIRLYHSQEQQFLSNLDSAKSYIERELRFKKVINRLIENEKKYQAEEKLLRRELF